MQDAIDLKLSSEALRVLGVMIEKEFTTPDNYPLTLNALVSGCNQTTNRNPIVKYDEMTIERGLSELRDAGLALRGVYAGSRVPKHRHSFNERFSISKDGLAVLAVLFLRGEQTLGEIKSRTERMVQFSDLNACDLAVSELVEFNPQLARRIEKEPGQKEGRIIHTLLSDSSQESTSGQLEPNENVIRPAFQLIDGELKDNQNSDDEFYDEEDLENRVELLEKEVTVLTHEIMSLRAEIDEMKDPSA